MADDDEICLRCKAGNHRCMLWLVTTEVDSECAHCMCSITCWRHSCCCQQPGLCQLLGMVECQTRLTFFFGKVSSFCFLPEKQFCSASFRSLLITYSVLFDYCAVVRGDVGFKKRGFLLDFQLYPIVQLFSLSVFFFLSSASSETFSFWILLLDHTHEEWLEFGGLSFSSLLWKYTVSVLNNLFVCMFCMYLSLCVEIIHVLHELCAYISPVTV